MNLTSEQRDILEAIAPFDKNLHINAIPGSAKTTTCLQIARVHPTRKILLLTYNKRLRKETLQRLNGATNIDVHTFHSFGYHNFHEKSCLNDIGLQRICTTEYYDASFAYDLLIIDEAQDMTMLLYRFVKKIYKYFEHKCPIVVVGDSRQCIFTFKGANERFLTLASSIFQWNSYPWVQKTLSVTFRCPPSVCAFINACLTPNDIALTSGKEHVRDTKPCYVVCNVFLPIRVVDIIRGLVTEEGAALHDILILFPSITTKNTTPVSKLCNMLSNCGYNLCIQFDHTMDIDEEILHDKIWISNFHKIKGIERKHVIVYNFDSMYFKCYGRNLPPSVLPNILYVALSRTSGTLHLINNESNRPLEFVSRESITKHCTYSDSELNRVFSAEERSGSEEKKINPSTFSNHINSILLSTCIAQLSLESYNKQRPLCFASKTDRSKHGSIENISDVNSEIINILLQRSCGNTCNLEKLFVETYHWLMEHDVRDDRYVLDEYETYDFTDVPAVTYLATAIVSYKSNLIFRLKQLHTYDWLSRYMIERTFQNLESFIEGNIEVPLYEENVVVYDNYFKKSFVGYIDCYDVQTDVVYEFKCTNAIEDHHIIQTIVYRYIMDLMIPDVTYASKTSYIYNMKTNEHLEITASHKTIKGIIERILRFKNTNTFDNESNDDFVRSCLKETLQYSLFV